MKFEARRIHFLSDVFVAVAFIVAKLPILAALPRNASTEDARSVFCSFSTQLPATLPNFARANDPAGYAG